MVALAVATHEENFVFGIRRCFCIESVDLLLKFLPLGEIAAAAGHSRVGAILQAEVGGSLWIVSEVPQICGSVPEHT